MSLCTKITNIKISRSDLSSYYGGMGNFLSFERPFLTAGKSLIDRNFGLTFIVVTESNLESIVWK